MYPPAFSYCKWRKVGGQGLGMELFIDCKKLLLLHVCREIKTVALLVITYKQRSVRKKNMYAVRHVTQTMHISTIVNYNFRHRQGLYKCPCSHISAGCMSTCQLQSQAVNMTEGFRQIQGNGKQDS